ncbi:MAG: ParA family protein [Saezia sp.]
MFVASIISTKGGPGKSTVSASLGGFIADAGLRVLLLDLDKQPTLSSYFKLVTTAECGMYELIATNERNLDRLISKTSVKNLDLIYSNDKEGQLDTLLLHAPDGRFRLRNLVSIFAPHYDLMIIDTQGTRSVSVEMALIASTKLISPVVPEILNAREFRRGTLKLLEDMQTFKHMGIDLPRFDMLINRVPAVSSSAKLVRATLREIFEDHELVNILNNEIPLSEAFAKAVIQAKPVHQVEIKKPAGRVMQSALDTSHAVASEMFPEWSNHFVALKKKYIANEAGVQK